MRLPFFIAFRYLFSRKKINAINIINGIAMIGFGVGAFAMVVILSAFNGFEVLVQELINNYDPDIKITSTHKKVFPEDQTMLLSLKDIPEVKQVSAVLEEKVVIKFNDRQEIAKIKGVDETYYKGGFDSLIVMGSFDLGDSARESSVFGAGLSSKLGIFPGSHSPVTVFVPRRDQEYNSLNPTASLSMAHIEVSGLFIVHEEIDNEVFISNLEFAQRLLEYNGAISAYELDLTSNADRADIKKEIEGMIQEIKN